MAWSDAARRAAIEARKWKRTAARNVRKLSHDEARAIVHRVNSQGATIFHDDIKRLTGGYQSQNINFHVMRLLGKKIGIIKR